MGGRSGTPARRDRAAGWRLVLVGVLAMVLLAAVTWTLPLRPVALRPTPPALAEQEATRATLDLGDGHACRVDPDGAVTCWGANGYGQLGLGVRTNGRTRPGRVVGLDDDVRSVSAGGSHSCALTMAGAVWCWGDNSSGQLGDGTTRPSLLPVAVRGLDDPAVALSAGASHTCVVTRSGGAACWGGNGEGQLGDGGSLPDEDGAQISSAPVHVVGLPDQLVSVSASLVHTCAVTVTRRVVCWGENSLGQLGDGAVLGLLARRPARRPPVEVVGLSGVTDVTTGVSHTCALTDTGGVLCWGANDQGQLGDGRPTVPFDESGESGAVWPGRSVPGAVVGLAAGVRSISAAQRTCAVTAARAVACWGPSETGEPGDGTGDGTATSSSVPTETVGSSPGASVVLLGALNACVATDDDAVSCWGENAWGQLGDGTTLWRRSPVPLLDASPSRPPGRPVTVNVIVLETDLDVTGGVGEGERRLASAQARQLLEEDPAMMRSIAEGFRAATAGALDPTVRVVTAARRLSVPRSECLDPNEHAGLVDAAARPAALRRAINLVVLQAAFCPTPAGEEVGGYDSPEGMPVVGWTTLRRPFEMLYTMIHEYGHELGLVHAGWSDCEDPVTHRNCTIDEVGDPASVMSYTHTSDAFTVAERHQAGLADDQEVVVSTPATTAAEFHLGKGGTTPSALLLDKGPDFPRHGWFIDDDRVYVTGDPGQLEVRFYNTGAQRSTRNPDASEISLTVVEWRVPKAGTRLYSDAEATVTYGGTDADGRVILRVAR